MGVPALVAELDRELRDVSKKRPQLAFDFLMDHIREVAGLTLREGSKYLTDEQRAALRRAR